MRWANDFLSVFNLGLYLLLSLIVGFYFFLILISIKLVKSGFLKDYLAGSSTVVALAVPEEDQAHEMSIHGKCTPFLMASQEEDALPPSARGMCDR